MTNKCKNIILDGINTMLHDAINGVNNGLDLSIVEMPVKMALYAIDGLTRSLVYGMRSDAFTESVNPIIYDIWDKHGDYTMTYDTQAMAITDIYNVWNSYYINRYDVDMNKCVDIIFVDKYGIQLDTETGYIHICINLDMIDGDSRREND